MLIISRIEIKARHNCRSFPHSLSLNSLQSIFARRVLDDGRSVSRLVRYAPLVQQHISNAVCDTLVSREGRPIVINKQRAPPRPICQRLFISSPAHYC
jgi:hypothetical protein